MKKIADYPLHPILWALFPPLALLGNNITHMTPINAIRALLVTVFVSAALTGLLRLVLRNWNKAAIVVTGFLVLFFSYGHIYNFIQNRVVLGVNVGRHRVLFPLFILVLGLIILWVTRRKDVHSLTKALNLIGALALIFPLYQITSYEIRASAKKVSEPNQLIQEQVAGLHLIAGVTPPDIYYLILDTYTRADTLNKYFSYDDSAFIQSLMDRGFYVASCSQSNFSYTALSLATSLNFNYPQSLNSAFTPSDKNSADIYPYLSENAVAYTLRQLGYRFEVIDSGFSPTELKNADIYYTPEDDWHSVFLGDGINSFESMELNTSAGMLLYEFNSYLPRAIQNFLSAYVLHRERILYALDVLNNMSKVPGPKFVFVHILAPHNPFVFGPAGEPIERKTFFTLNDDREVVTFAEYEAGYRDQVTYLNQRVLGIVDSLIEDSSQPPIIILQGDHGVIRLPGWEDTILNTYYLPRGDYTGFYPNISPVNSFREIFNIYFGGQLPLLPDQSCTMNPDGDPYSCVPIPDPNPVCALQSLGQNP